MPPAIEIPTVSVVMTVYDGAPYLEDAIRSILDQSLTDFEFIVVDDGSADASPSILERFATEDRRVRIVTQPHAGIAAAANRGCRSALGDFVARMDADDLSFASRLERQVAFLREHPDIGVVGADIRELGADRSFAAADHPRPEKPDVVRWNLMFGNCIANPTAMVRRTLFERLGYYRDGVAEDYDFWIRASEVTKLANLAFVLVDYRVWPGQSTRRLGGRMAAHSLELRTAMIGSLLGRIVPARMVELTGDDSPNSTATEEERASAGSLLAEVEAAYSRRFALDAEDAARIARDLERRLERLNVR
jgi:glycosyltransferase involved in cell wall biosynthesis